MNEHDRFYADGQWVLTESAPRMALFNPATDEQFASVAVCSGQDVDRAVVAAHRALPGWAATPPAQRIAAVTRIRDGIEARRDELARTITQEMGVPLGLSRAAQLGLPLRDIDAALRAMQALSDEMLGTTLVTRDPAGVVAAITPWNFPLHQIAAKIAPALLAGCTVVLKPSEITPLDAIMLAEIVEAAGLPAGVFNLVPGDASTGSALVEHRLVDMISFTGSGAAGAHIAGVAARGLKKVALELGGKSANIVLDDVALEQMIPAALGQCFINSGQVCAALSRLLVPASMYGRACELAVEASRGWILGDPLDEATRMGPLASRRQQQRVQSFITTGIAQGATLLTGGAEQPHDLPHGAYVQPTIFGDVRSGMTIAREEIFGPVLLLQAYADEEQAIGIANDSDYGLSGGVWAQDRERAIAVARRMRTGQVVLNGAMLDVDAPFGGCKRSGLGRENGRWGLEEFFQVKAILGAG